VLDRNNRASYHNFRYWYGFFRSLGLGIVPASIEGWAYRHREAVYVYLQK
jgi:hypothetical protein